MIIWLKTWVNQIIVAVIIAVILEMIIPKCKSKKYIKMVLSIYILFTIIHPIVSKISNQDMITTFNYHQYFEDEPKISEKQFEETNSKMIEDTYQNNIKEDLTAKLEEKGYKIEKAEININRNTADKNYGKIKKIILWLSKKEEVNNTIQVNHVNINEKVQSKKIREKETKEIKEYIKQTYQIDAKSIEIN